MVKTLLYEQELLNAIQSQLASAQRFKIATAMLSVAGWKLVEDSIKQSLQKGG